MIKKIRKRRSNIQIKDIIKLCAVIVLFVFSLIIVLPTIITYLYGNVPEANEIEDYQEDYQYEDVPIDTRSFENITDQQMLNMNINDFEEYILHVVAAEMPISFEMEALKAQAVAARTYALKQLERNGDMDVVDIGQAFLTTEQMAERFGESLGYAYAKLREVIDSTRGQIIVYNDEPIEAVFHSTSAGVTEYSENFWLTSLPYLVSVESRGDEYAPNFLTSEEISRGEVINLLKDRIGRDIPINSKIEILSRSDAGYVIEVDIDGDILTGRDIRELFYLRSSNFTIQYNEDSVIFTTRGYGHGVGMSQYGANHMAYNGQNYLEILLHYYSGVDVKKLY